MTPFAAILAQLAAESPSARDSGATLSVLPSTPSESNAFSSCGSDRPAATPHALPPQLPPQPPPPPPAPPPQPTRSDLPPLTTDAMYRDPFAESVDEAALTSAGGLSAASAGSASSVASCCICLVSEVGADKFTMECCGAPVHIECFAKLCVLRCTRKLCCACQSVLSSSALDFGTELARGSASRRRALDGAVAASLAARAANSSSGIVGEGSGGFRESSGETS